ncbi:MAG: PorT family protein [Bacteroidetes bacterium]|nr:PorT family protein [Bacteroidota bacterium]
MKHSITLIFTLFLCSTLSAQLFKGGIHGGIVASQIDGDKMSGYRKFSPYGGLFVRHPLGTGKWSAQLELNYAGRGARSDDGNIRTSMGYAEIPLFVVCNVFHFPFQIRAGMAASYKIFEKTETFGIVSSSNDYGSWDFPLLVGVDYQITERIAVDARFSYSALRVGKQFYHNALSFGLRYYIAL